MRMLLLRVIWPQNRSHLHLSQMKQKGIIYSLVVDFSGELSPMSQASDSESKPKRKRTKAMNTIKSLNDNLHATYFSYLYKLFLDILQ